MLARARARDARFDGVFLTCVRTTGIYCLPSCRARAPKPENVEHHPTPSIARARGFRPCRRCRPDDFYAGVDRDRLALLDALVALRASPSEFENVASLATRVGCGATKLAALCRRHLGRTPAELLRAARIEHACNALRHTDRNVLDIALDAGFATSSAFHANFKRATGSTPGAYRRGAVPS